MLEINHVYKEFVKKTDKKQKEKFNTLYAQHIAYQAVHKPVACKTRFGSCWTPRRRKAFFLLFDEIDWFDYSITSCEVSTILPRGSGAACGGRRG